MNAKDAALIHRYKASLFYRLVDAAKVRILNEALRRHGGNRTHAAGPSEPREPD